MQFNVYGEGISGRVMVKIFDTINSSAQEFSSMPLQEVVLLANANCKVYFFCKRSPVATFLRLCTLEMICIMLRLLLRLTFSIS